MSLWSQITKGISQAAGLVAKVEHAVTNPVETITQAAQSIFHATPAAGTGGVSTAMTAPVPPNAAGIGFNFQSPSIAGYTIAGGVNVGGSSGVTGFGGYTNSNPSGFSAPAVTAGAGGACPKGYHLNKHALPASKRHGAVPARSICVRNRHMNPLNHRADARALRRLKRANKMTRKIHNLFHRRSSKPAGRKR